MKRAIALIATIFFAFSLLASSALAGTASGKYGIYDNFKDLYDAYFEAVKTGDTTTQDKLLEIARVTLQQDIELGHSGIQPIYDPDEQYWNQQFISYFSTGYWETRDNGICLSLFPRTPTYWSDSQKLTAWNATFSKFHNDSKWDNTSCMEEQFYCHARLYTSMIETEWNLEPWKTSINPIFCN